MKIQILDRAKKKRFLRELGVFGLKKISGMLVRSGKERIRAFSGDLSREEVMEIWRLFPIEGVGLYVGKDMVNRNGVHEVRLSVDGIHLWKSQLKERIIELSEEQEGEWFAGVDVEVESDLDKGFVLVMAGGDFVGMGKLGVRDEELGVRILYSFLPKERRRRERG